MKRAKMLVLWLAFSVVFALGPLFANYLVTRDEASFSWLVLYDRGELFFIAIVLCGDTVGRLFNQKSRGELPTICCLVFAVYILFGLSVKFGTVAVDLARGGRIPWRAAHDSFWGLIGAVAAGTGSIWIVEE
jgi:hypothetical protein